MTSTAATLGQRLLDEVKEESLDELLRNLRKEFSTDDAFFGIKDFDELLHVALGAHQPFAGTQNQHVHQSAAFGSSSKRKLPVIEISSPSSGGGKSQLLYYFIAMSVLPSTFNGHKLDGRGGVAILLDADGRFDVRRLHDIIAGIVRHALSDADVSSNTAIDKAINALIHTTLQYVHIFRPQTSSSLLSTLNALDTYLLNHSQTTRSRPLQGIFLDSASAFYWTDRLRDEISRTQEIGLPATEIQRRRKGRTSFYMSVLYSNIAGELRRLQSLFGCAIVYTTWGITPRSSSSVEGYGHIWSGPPTFKPHLPSPWNSTFPDLRLVVQRDHVREYPATSTFSDWERDAAIRQDVVKRGKFSAWVDTSNLATTWVRGGGEDVLGALRKLPDNGGFPFWVREDGVFMDDLMGDIS
ncbi:Rad51 family DNA repair protein, putative [Talaromyces stipitatus ATCC 10500]|uniref:Rad51 family DNA repair protein, putative n=1 Tax=Talaromyces stipitatus (strain ATCC 10500 / CBS 375.48 / QM 6759 / NRRL 1006) TaxID=441959 RepID=B8MS22_TALSN|nr:Rad51 family DNA repair protein, putative [Talaromyces stipitatus ATCC 10500]EED12200.1 Rad51 family DNA repair protein, putative [Talaromyces stipitatus ATCC 10500]